MVSNEEELVLLLKKWMSESTQVAVVVLLNKDGEERKGTVQVRGEIFEIDESEKRFFVAGENNNFASVSYANCNFVYDADDSIPRAAAKMTAITGEQYHEVVILGGQSSVTIAIFSVTPAPEE